MFTSWSPTIVEAEFVKEQEERVYLGGASFEVSWSLSHVFQHAKRLCLGRGKKAVFLPVLIQSVWEFALC